MTPRTRQFILAAFAIGCAAILVIALGKPELFSDPRRPEGLREKAQWLMEHPADWIAASEISEIALDSPSPRRFELWYAAYAHAQRLAPHRENTSRAFVRGGLFHWYELGPADRKRVLEAAAPLMRDPGFFGRMYAPLYQLTRDFAWLRRVAPDTLDARRWLRDLAIVRGLFADYRALRGEIRRERMEVFESIRAGDDVSALLDLVPTHIDAGDEPLVRAILEELERKPFSVAKLSGAIERVVEYAVRHDVQPLSGLKPLVTNEEKLQAVTRARLALAMNDPSAANGIELTSSVTGTSEWSEYYLDRALFEARRGDALLAEGYLLRAMPSGTTMRLLATAEEVAKAGGKLDEAARYRRQLEERSRQPRTWSGTCGAELCRAVQTTEYVIGNGMRLETATVQSDETPPYVEIYVDDVLVAEGEVGESRVFEVPASPGLHRVEVRLVNERTRNGAQRRVSLG